MFLLRTLLFCKLLFFLLFPTLTFVPVYTHSTSLSLSLSLLELDHGDFVPFDELPALERLLLHRLHRFNEEMESHYESLRLSRAHATLQQLLATDLSALFCDVRKDTLYADAANAHSRRAAQTVRVLSVCVYFYFFLSFCLLSFSLFLFLLLFLRFSLTLFVFTFSLSLVLSSFLCRYSRVNTSDQQRAHHFLFDFYLFFCRGSKGSLAGSSLCVSLCFACPSLYMPGFL